MSCPLRAINNWLTLCCLVGLGLSIYAFAVEQAVEKNPNYHAMCDLGDRVSCTNVFKSDYAKGFGIVGKLFGKDHSFNKPNSLFGIIFYSLIATLAQASTPFTTKFSAYAILLSNFASLYFAYILVFILNDLCIVCVSTYLVNGLNLLIIYIKNKHVSGRCRCSSLKRTKIKSQ